MTLKEFAKMLDGREYGGEITKRRNMMKSPCVKDCPDRIPCGLCRKTCEKFLEYESERLKEKKMDVGTITIARKAICRKSFRSEKRNRRHVR